MIGIYLTNAVNRKGRTVRREEILREVKGEGDATRNGQRAKSLAKTDRKSISKPNF